jgi:glyoxylase-like metal-dependent hydrolase (beta-lactamase superfamily II)
MTLRPWLLALLLTGCFPRTHAAQPPPRSDLPDLAYLEAVNRVGPPRDPQLLFLLMAQYANANRAGEGVEFFAGRLQEYGPRLADPQRALYLAALGLLRARHAPEVSLLARWGWVKDTVAMLQESEHLSGGRIFVVRWIAGLVYAQLPALFHQRPAARTELAWCLDHADLAPHPGWLREVHHQLAVLARAEGDQAGAQDHLRRSGYPTFDRPITLTTPFSEELATGHTFAARRVREVLPGRVYALSGFEFTEYYFVVSADRRHLVGIDAGTRPDAAASAYQALRAQAPGLPPLDAVLFTHAHWDHVGGQRAFRQLEPRPTFYASSRYQEELARSVQAPARFAPVFFGQRFSLDEVRAFKPDVTIDGPTDLVIGGTRIEAIPVQGGETDDALLFHFPDERLMFVGDIAMPYLGAPFVEEGSLEGLLSAIDTVVARHPERLLHGHEPLTRIYPTPTALAAIAPHLAWLRERVLAAIAGGADRSELHRANLVPPRLLADPDAQLPYLILRGNVIDRLYDQHVGYWQPDLAGVDHLGRRDQGEILIDYLGLSEGDLAAAVRRMIGDGRHELAASVFEATRGRFAAGGPLAAAGRMAYQRLMEKFQDTNPFKFILYSNRAGEQLPAMAP